MNKSNKFSFPIKKGLRRGKREELKLCDDAVSKGYWTTFKGMSIDIVKPPAGSVIMLRPHMNDFSVCQLASFMKDVQQIFPENNVCIMPIEIDLDILSQEELEEVYENFKCWCATVRGIKTNLKLEE